MVHNAHRVGDAATVNQPCQDIEADGRVCGPRVKDDFGRRLLACCRVVVHGSKHIDAVGDVLEVSLLAPAHLESFSCALQIGCLAGSLAGIAALAEPARGVHMAMPRLPAHEAGAQALSSFPSPSTTRLFRHYSFALPQLRTLRLLVTAVIASRFFDIVSIRLFPQARDGSCVVPLLIHLVQTAQR